MGRLRLGRVRDMVGYRRKTAIVDSTGKRHKVGAYLALDQTNVQEIYPVCAVGKRRELEVITWGALQQMTPRFFRTYCDEAWTYVSPENLRSGRNPEGFDLARLKADLKALAAAQV